MYASGAAPRSCTHHSGTPPQACSVRVRGQVSEAAVGQEDASGRERAKGKEAGNVRRHELAVQIDCAALTPLNVQLDDTVHIE
eukprot:COSAG01_NODE_2424_length_7722_cov_216.956448_3_plen_83_part_00